MALDKPPAICSHPTANCFHRHPPNNQQLTKEQERELEEEEQYEMLRQQLLEEVHMQLEEEKRRSLEMRLEESNAQEVAFELQNEENVVEEKGGKGEEVEDHPLEVSFSSSVESGSPTFVFESFTTETQTSDDLQRQEVSEEPQQEEVEEEEVTLEEGLRNDSRGMKDVENVNLRTPTKSENRSPSPSTNSLYISSFFIGLSFHKVPNQPAPAKIDVTPAIKVESFLIH